MAGDGRGQDVKVMANKEIPVPGGMVDRDLRRSRLNPTGSRSG